MKIHPVEVKQRYSAGAAVRTGYQQEISPREIAVVYSGFVHLSHTASDFGSYEGYILRPTAFPFPYGMIWDMAADIIAPSEPYRDSGAHFNVAVRGRRLYAGIGQDHRVFKTAPGFGTAQAAVNEIIGKYRNLEFLDGDCPKGGDIKGIDGVAGTVVNSLGRGGHTLAGQSFEQWPYSAVYRRIGGGDNNFLSKHRGAGSPSENSPGGREGAPLTKLLLCSHTPKLPPRKFRHTPAPQSQKRTIQLTPAEEPESHGEATHTG